MQVVEDRICPKCRQIGLEFGNGSSYCRACQRDYEKAWRRNNPERQKAQRRRAYVRKAYGISYDQYEAMVELQGGACAVCGVHGDTQQHGVLLIDHDHDTGRVRGLLCVDCNFAIGRTGRNVTRLAKAIAYISSPPFEDVAA